MTKEQTEIDKLKVENEKLAELLQNICKDQTHPEFEQNIHNARVYIKAIKGD